MIPALDILKDKTFYIFLLYCCQWPRHLIYHRKTIDWLIKNISWSHTWWETAAAAETIWVTHVDSVRLAIWWEWMALRVTEIRMLIKSSAYHLDPSSHQTWNTPTITDWLQKKGLYLSDAETSTACRLVTPAKSWSLCLTVKNTTSHRTTSKIWFLHGVFNGVVPLLKLFQITLLLLQSDGLTLVTLLCLPKLIHVMCWVYSRPGTVH